MARKKKAQVTPSEKALDYPDFFDTGGLGADFRSYDANSLDRTTLKALFYTEDWVFITVDAIAQPLSRVPWLVYRKVNSNGKETWVPDQQHPLNKLLDNPSPRIDAATFKYMAFSEDALMGNALIWYARQLNQLHIVPAEIVDYDFDMNTGEPTRIRVINNQFGREITKAVLTLEDVCHVMRPNTSNKFWGLSPFIPTQRSVKFQTYTTEFMNAFYQRGATPQAMLELDRDANEQNAIRLLSKFENAYSGRRNTRRTMLLPKGVKFSPIDLKIADQQLIEMISMYRENILNALHIPKHIVSLNEAGSLGSEEFKQSLKYFWQATLIPITERFAGRLTSFFAEQLGPDRCIGFDFTDIEVLQDDKMKQAQLAQALLSVMTVNEIRAQVFELPAVEGGDTIPALQPAQQQLPFQALSAEPPSQIQPNLSETLSETASETLSDSMKRNEETLSDSMKRNEETLSDSMKRNEETLKKYGEQIKAMDAIITAEETPKVQQQIKSALTMLDEQIDAAMKALDESLKKKASFDKDEFEKEYKKLLESIAPDVAERYTAELTPSMELGYRAQLAFIVNGDDRQTVDALRTENKDKRRAILSDRGIEIFRSTGDTTGKQTITATNSILDDIAAGRAEQMTLTEIADKIKGKLKESAQGRAGTIARTETLTAVSLGQQAMIEDAAESGIKLVKIWFNAGDSRVRGNPSGLYPDAKSDHWDVHGEVVPVGNKFSNGLMYPRDTSAPIYASVNCRCRMITVPADEVGDLEIPGVTDIPNR